MTDLSKLSPDEINERVAKKLRGPSQKCGPHCPCHRRNYCGSIEAAFEILDAWHGDWELGRQNNIFRCVLYRPGEGYDGLSGICTKAICLAFLKVKE